MALRQELETLRSEFAAFRAALAPTAAPESTATPVGPDAAATGGSEHEHSGSMTTRRTLLKWGGVGAAAAIAAAGGAGLTSQTAHAATGGNFILGAGNTASNPTLLTFNGADKTGLSVTATSPDFLTTGVIGIGTGVGVKGDATDGGGTGVLGTVGTGVGVQGTSSANGTGVSGQSVDYYGVWGQSTNSIGVNGTSTNNSGVEGYSANDIAIRAVSGSLPDLAALGTGRILQTTTNTVGAPTSGHHFAGEQIRDYHGDLYICIAVGTPGTWKKVAALSTAYIGGAIGFLSTPIRVYDSRTSNNPLVGNQARSIQITNVAINNVKVPAGATGCIGNLTVVRPTTGGYLVIYPQGSPTPSSSTVNYVTGQTVPNSFMVGLSSSGLVTVHAFQSGNCHFIIDITGFVA